jgi:hypothetical protein
MVSPTAMRRTAPCAETSGASASSAERRYVVESIVL